MTEYTLNNQILKTVENQIIENDPACARDTFVQLMEMGYSQIQSVEMIGSVLVQEMNDIMINGRNFNEVKYASQLSDLIKMAADQEVESLNMDEIEKERFAGYEAMMSEDKDAMAEHWMVGFELIKEYINDQFKDHKPELSEVDENTQFKYNLAVWFEDMEQELDDAGKQKERIRFCKEMLEVFAWKEDAKDGFRAAIGEAYFAMGQKDECKEFFEKWLEEEPFNHIAVNSYLHCLVDMDEMAYAETIAKDHIDDKLECDLDTELLFRHAQSIFEKLENHEKATMCKEKIAKFHEKCLRLAKAYETDVLPFKNGKASKKKIYPNALCPCGSGKKYKQCCGK